MTHRFIQKIRTKLLSWSGSGPLPVDSDAGRKEIDSRRFSRQAIWKGLAVFCFCLFFFWLGKTTSRIPHGFHTQSETGPRAKKEVKFWTCSMHPNIKLPQEGKCPLCFMDLTPAHGEAEGSEEEGSLALGEYARKLAEVETSPVVRRPLSYTLRMVGKIDYDETGLSNITLWTPGDSRIVRLFVNFTGALIKKNEPLLEVYSPDLIAAQGEYLSAHKAFLFLQKSPQKEARESVRLNLEAATRKLLDLGMTGPQIEEIQKRGVPDHVTTIYSPIDGTVIARMANEGEWQSRGTTIYKIADLTRVWVRLQAYESDLIWVRYSQPVKFEVEAYPGTFFSGLVTFVDPFLNEETRTVAVRVDALNPDGRLKPGMFVRALLDAQIDENGRALSPPLDSENIPRVLSVPSTAPLLTGKRAIVYVEEESVREEDGRKRVVFRYSGREVALGPRAGEYYLVLSGLKEGEKVVTRGAFKIDSSLQILARPSMMDPSGPGETRAHPPEKETELILTSKDAPCHRQMGDFLEAYLFLVDELSKDRPDHLGHFFRKAEEILAKIDLSRTGLEGESQKEMEKTVLALRASLQIASHDIKTVRTALISISDRLTDYLERFGHRERHPLYKIFCPMANDDKGAFWWQRSAEVANPYFGATMLPCGVVRNELAPLK